MGWEVQLLALTTRGQEVTASGLEDRPIEDRLVVAVGGEETREGNGWGVKVDAVLFSDPPNTDTLLWNDIFWGASNFPSFLG